jgi:hypothetical protein
MCQYCNCLIPGYRGGNKTCKDCAERNRIARQRAARKTEEGEQGQVIILSEPSGDFKPGASFSLRDGYASIKAFVFDGSLVRVTGRMAGIYEVRGNKLRHTETGVWYGVNEAQMRRLERKSPTPPPSESAEVAEFAQILTHAVQKMEAK